jgi:hypothetical protein
MFRLRAGNDYSQPLRRGIVAHRQGRIPSDQPMSETPVHISRMWQKDYYSTALFWYIRGIKSKLPGITNIELFRAFRKDAALSEIDWSDAALKKAYERQQETYYDHLRSDG